MLVNTWLFGSQSYRETITVNLTILLLILVSATVKQKIRRFWTFGIYYFVLFFIQDKTQLRIHTSVQFTSYSRGQIVSKVLHSHVTRKVPPNLSLPRPRLACHKIVLPVWMLKLIFHNFFLKLTIFFDFCRFSTSVP